MPIHFTITRDKSQYVRLLVIIAAALFVAAMTVILYTSRTDEVDGVLGPFGPTRRAVLMLEGPVKPIRVGETVEVHTTLETSYAIAGSDIVLTYDPRMLTLVPVAPDAPTLAARYLNTALSVFDLFPTAELTEEGTTAILSFSALAKPLEQFRGQGEVATLRFKALHAGVASISFLFTSGSVTDSNVAVQGRDVLTAVRDLTFTIEP